MDHRWHKVHWGAGQQRQRTSAANWQMPVKWEREHKAFAVIHGRRRRVFCASLADVFDNEAPEQWRKELFSLIAATPHLDWLLLTKRIGNAEKMMNWDFWHPNIWLGATVVNQEEADRDIPKLLRVPVRVRWLSMEPLLGPVSLRGHFDGLHWVVVGGESGNQPRLMAAPWARDLQNQCAIAGVPYFFKQWGGTAKDKGGCVLGDGEAKAWPVAA